jgi:hypothetical protein
MLRRLIVFVVMNYPGLGIRGESGSVSSATQRPFVGIGQGRLDLT